MRTHDCAGLQELFQAFFASIPYQWYANNDIANYEGFYASVFYSYFAALGYETVVEESSSHGRLDMAVRTDGHVYLFEFKVAEMAPPGSALAQLQQRDYAAKYRDRGEPIHLIGVEFSRQTRNVAAFEGSRRLTHSRADLLIQRIIERLQPSRTSTVAHAAGLPLPRERPLSRCNNVPGQERDAHHHPAHGAVVQQPPDRRPRRDQPDLPRPRPTRAGDQLGGVLLPGIQNIHAVALAPAGVSYPG